MELVNQEQSMKNRREALKMKEEWIRVESLMLLQIRLPFIGKYYKNR